VNAPAARQWLSWLALALLCACVFGVYWPGLDGGFIFDDLPNIVNNPELHVTTTSWDDWLTAIFSSPSSSLQRPLAMLSFAINHYFTGLDPRPMKLVNIALHAFNALLVFGLVRALLRARALPGDPGTDRRDWAARFIAFAWALHPINLMAVLFVVQRMESLCHLFVFAGLWLYVDGRRRQMQGDPGWWRILAGLVAGSVLGLLAKESAVLLPLYALCVELCLFRFEAARPRDRATLRWMYVFGLLLPALLGVAWLLPQALQPGSYDGRNFSLVERLLTETRVVMQYLSWCVYPDVTQLSLYHDDFRVSHSLLDPPTTAAAIAGIAALLCLAGFARTRRPLVALGLLWFFAAQALTATFIPLELMFEHRNYFASLGICLALADLLLLWPRGKEPRRLGVLAAAGLVLLFAAGTCLRAQEWSHPLRFARSEVAKHPDSPRASYELARMLVFLTGYKAGSPYLPATMAAIEAAREVPGSNVLPEQAALIVASRTGLPLRDEWWDGLEWKLRHQPFGRQALGAVAAMVDCAGLRLCHFPPDRMLEVFGAAMSRSENDAELFNLYGSYAGNSLHDPALALKAWRESVRLAPSEPQYRINLARLLILLGKHDEAREQIAALRGLGRLGQYESPALKLEAALRKASAPKPPMPEPTPRDE
jgi:hypothetical protein